MANVMIVPGFLCSRLRGRHGDRSAAGSRRQACHDPDMGPHFHSCFATESIGFSVPRFLISDYNPMDWKMSERLSLLLPCLTLDRLGEIPCIVLIC